MHNYRRMSRRAVLRSAALPLGAATATAVVSQTAAQQKISQADAKYQATPKGDLHCDGCVNFQPPNGCIRSRRDQRERLVPVVCPEGEVLTALCISLKCRPLFVVDRR